MSDMGARWFSADGIAHLMTKQGKPERIKDVAEINRRKEICLSCTKEKCRGTDKCFKKMKGVQNED